MSDLKKQILEIIKSYPDDKQKALDLVLQAISENESNNPKPKE